MKKVMKSILAMVVCLSVVLTTFSMTAFAATAIKVSPVYIETADGVITASAVVSNIDGDEAVQARLVIAQYEGNFLSSIASGTATIAAGGEGFVEATDAVVPGATVKFLLWENESLKPLSSLPDTAAVPGLSGITVDGVLLVGFSTDTTAYTINVPAGGTIPYLIKGIPTNSALVSKTVISDNTATVTVKNPSTEASKEYKITFALEQPNYTHAVQGATEESAFSEKPTSKYFSDESRTATVVATSVVGGDGKLYTNLHAADNATIGADNSDVSDGTTLGSPAVDYNVDKASASSRYIHSISDSDAVGADYFIFTGGNSCSYLWSDTNTEVGDLTNGAALLKFKLTDPARVTIYAGRSTKATSISPNESDLINCGYIAAGWTYEKAATGTPYMVSDRVTYNSSHTEEYNYKFYKDFNAGEVVIPYYKAFGSNITQAPIITVKPVGGQKKVIVASDFENIVFGMTIEEYMEYAGETVTPNESADENGVKDSEKTADFTVALRENFGIDSVVDKPSDGGNFRKVTYINPLYGIDGAYWINFDKGVTANGSSAGWVVEAYSGDARKYPDYDKTIGQKPVGFAKEVPWASFKVNVDCDVLIASVSEIPNFEEMGYVEYIPEEGYTSAIFKTLRVRDTGNEELTFNHLYVKPFEADSTVHIYNCIGGYQDHVYLVRPR